MINRIFVSACLLIFIQLATAQSLYNHREAFHPIFYPYPGNEYRSASGEPGPKYWQNSADYFIDWKIEILPEGMLEPIVIDYNAKGKKVRIINQSPSLGDCIAWTPIVSEFQKKHECVVDYFTPYLDLFKDQYKNINFLPYSEHNKDQYYATYDLGYYFNEREEKTPIDARKRNLQQTACDILGLPYKEIKPSLFLENKTRPLSEKYICITTSSTAGCKHWQNEKGWQKVVDYVNNLGYKVVVIQKEALDYMDLRGLKNVIHPTTESLQEAMSWINYWN
jgi:autotransporter strand-loop-strand O-heptosyltransferase